MADTTTQTKSQVEADPCEEIPFQDITADEIRKAALSQDKSPYQYERKNTDILSDFEKYADPKLEEQRLIDAARGGLTPDQLINIRRARMENNPETIAKEINKFIEDYKAATGDDLKKRSVAEAFEVYLDATLANGRHHGDGLQTAINSWKGGSEDFLKTTKEMLDSIDEKQTDASGKKQDSYQKLIGSQLKVSGELRNQALTSMSALRTEQIIEDYIKSGKEMGEKEVVSRLIECGRPLLGDIEQKKAFFDDLKIDKSALQSQGLKRAVEILESDNGNPDQVMAKALFALLQDKGKSGLSTDEYKRIVPAFFYGMKNEQQLEFWKSFMSAAGKDKDGQPIVTKPADMSLAFDHFNDCLRDIGQYGAVEPLVRKIISRGDSDISLQNPLIRIAELGLLKNMANAAIQEKPDIAAAEMVLLALATSDSPREMLKVFLGAQKEDEVDYLARQKSWSTNASFKNIIQSAIENNAAAVKAEVIEWSIKNNSPELFKAITKSVNNQFEIDIDKAHAVIMHRDNPNEDVSQAKDSNGNIDYSKLLEIRFKDKPDREKKIAEFK